MTSKKAVRYDQGLLLAERWRLQELRKQLLRDVHGDVLEIGAGTGANLPLYGPNVSAIVLDRDIEMLLGLRTKYPGSAHLSATAEELPFPDNSFDFAVGTLVFCSIGEPRQALAELRRVLRPGGGLRLLEHVRGLHPVTRRLTDWLNPFWFRLTQECNLNRETALTVQAAGFGISRTRNYLWGLLQEIEATAPLDGAS